VFIALFVRGHYQIEKLSADIIEEDRIDKSWSMISQIKGFDGKPKFSELANLMLGILVIPHSNADSERIRCQKGKCVIIDANPLLMQSVTKI
jgi:hypothetical protein